MSSQAVSPLVDVAWLAAHLGDPGVRLADVRWYFPPARGADAYARGHLPGAVFVDLDQDLAAPRGEGPGRHPLPSAAAFTATLARLGVGEGTTVVAYDDVGGAMASRLWWLLRYFGHPVGRVLDGGLGAWTARGLPLTTEVPAVAPAPPLRLAAGGARVIDKEAVGRLAATPGAVVLDARATPRYEGVSEPIDARAGHVPGARSAPFAGNLASPGGVFLPPEALAARYRELGALGPGEVACYCGSGVTACHDLLALSLAGRDDAALYEGSWSDWAADPALPAATGPTP